MKNVAVFFGGKSVEHDISIITAMQIIKNLNVFKYNIIPVYIAKDNTFYSSDLLKQESIFKNLQTKNLNKVTLIVPDNKLYIYKKNKVKNFCKLDFAFIACHGGIGENGELLSLLNMCNIPVSTGNVLSLAAAMDKEKTKIFINGLNLPFAPYFAVEKKNRRASEVVYCKTDLEKLASINNTEITTEANVGGGVGMADETNADRDVFIGAKTNEDSRVEIKSGTNSATEIEKATENRELNAAENLTEKVNKLGYPVIVKPANLGSSIGIKKANNLEELNDALNYAFRFDNKAIVEKFLTDFCELNCSSIITENEILASEIEEPIKLDEFLSFENKYISNAGSKKTVQSSGMQTLKRKFPASLPTHIKDKIQDITKTVYKKLNFSGVLRIDYFYNRNTNEIYLNEINSIPGSMAFYLWDNYCSFSGLLDKIICEGEEIFKTEQKKQTFFESSVLNGYINGNNGAKLK